MFKEPTIRTGFFFLFQKHHNTYKALIGTCIMPSGAIVFISNLWGGSTSDKYITMHSGFLFNVQVMKSWQKEDF